MVRKMETEKEVIEALRLRYPSNAYAVLTQVSNGTGLSISRWADALVMSLWESRRFELMGCEIKVTREDWLRELKHPEKADVIANYCDSWYLVVGDADIIKPGELPMGWGLMVPHTSKSLKVAVKCERNLQPKPLDRSFLASILRRTMEQLTDDARLMAEYGRGYDIGVKEGLERSQYSIDSARDQLETLKTNVADFEKASEIKINEMWSGPTKVGEAVRLVLSGHYRRELDLLEDLHRRFVECTKKVEEEIAKHKEAIK